MATEDDEQASAVQEGLAGVMMCPKCGLSMQEIHVINPRHNLSAGVERRTPAWLCAPCSHVVLRDGKGVVVDSSFTSITQAVQENDD